MNRVNEPRESWGDVESVSDVLVYKWYNAVGGTQYNLCMEYLDNRDYENADYEHLVCAVIPIYYGLETDFTGGAHFIFDVGTKDGKRLEDSLKQQPDRYTYCGPFDGVDATAFCMYRCEY